MSGVARVLAPTDFGEASQAAVEYACTLAEQLDAELHLLHVVTESSLPFLGGNTPDRLQTARQDLGKLPAQMSPKTLAITRTVSEGKPADEILRYVAQNEIGMVVMGTHAREGLAHVFLGSVAEQLIRTAPCPVVIVRAALPQVQDRALDDVGASAVRRTPRPPSLGQIPESNRVLELLHRALEARATDVHIDPISSDQFRIRFRIDGRLEQYCIVDRTVGMPLLMQLKVMSQLDITQPFEPNEGRLRLPESMPDTEVRITTIPVYGGDAVALRLLKHEKSPPSLNKLGFASHALQAVHAMLHAGEGLVLVTGPTGSGKTTTVHAMLRMLDSGDRNIVSIEDPVEYRVPAIRQLSVDLRHGVTMTRGLRTLLRMDPDVVFIGEIRDVEAMEIALRAASAGKYVFSTLHTRDVASTVTALRDLHADNLSLGGNLKGIVSQRLMRCICDECCGRSACSGPERDVFLSEGVEPPDELVRPQGCPHCRNTGFRGRIGVFETLPLAGEISEAIQRGAAEDELRQMIRAAGTPSLMADALTKVCEGVTALEEARSIRWA